MDISITKRSGQTEKYDISKIHKVIENAIVGIKNVSLSEIEINAKINFREGISTKEIHKALVESAANLISENSPEYQWVAGNLLNFSLRKDVWGGKNPPKLYDFITAMIGKNIYSKDLLSFSKKEMDKLDEYMDHKRDFLLAYAGIRQMCDKYLLQNRTTKEIYETPQFAYMCMAMAAFKNYSNKTRIDKVCKFYDSVSLQKVNIPTPVLGKLRGNSKSYASCCLIDVGDSTDSILASISAVGKATANSYGIGVNIGRIRSAGSPIRGGETSHVGVIPFLKVFESQVKAWHQGGIRGGSGTVTLPFFHYEVEDVIVLKNNAGTDDNRVRKLDYAVSFSKLFYSRVIEDKTITLFNPNEVQDVCNAFGFAEFDELYVNAENNPNIKIKKVIPARKLFSLFVKERVETGRIYVLNIDHVNSHGCWIDQVVQTNLCTEVVQPMIPINDLNDPHGEIGVCILSAINILNITDWQDLKRNCRILVEYLDEIIDHQDYFNKAAQNFAQKRRSLGIGVTNLAAWLAKNGILYSDSKACELVNEWMERFQYYLLEASNDLAKEKGACEKFHRCKYSNGLFPIDTYNKNVDSIVSPVLKMDWAKLRKDIQDFGLRHSSLSAFMPVESSSVIQSSTNGIEPIRSKVTFKTSKTGTLPVVAPGLREFGDNYDLAFNFKDNIGFLNIQAVIQKWIDMAISGNTYYNYTHYEGGRLPDSKIMKEILYAYKMGIFSLYYCNTSVGDHDQSLDVKEDSCVDGVCKL